MKKKNIFYNKEYENQIKITKVIYNNLNYNMYIYRTNDAVSDTISKANKWETFETKNILDALNYYSIKNNIKKTDIYIIDIGANIGWYTFILAKYGYRILSFEPSKENYYILLKNYCLNKNLKITLINKGIFTEEKNCYLYSNKVNFGNGILKCDENIDITNVNFHGEIILTKLSNYIPFLSNKKLAFIKIDIEGAEGKAIDSGIDLITKYHIPFIFIEFTPSALQLYGTNPKKFLQIFINNGYKISLKSFLSNKYSSPEEILAKVANQANIYIIYTKILNQ